MAKRTKVKTPEQIADEELAKAEAAEVLGLRHEKKKPKKNTVAPVSAEGATKEGGAEGEQVSSETKVDGEKPRKEEKPLPPRSKIGSTITITLQGFSQEQYNKIGGLVQADKDKVTGAINYDGLTTKGNTRTLLVNPKRYGRVRADLLRIGVELPYGGHEDTGHIVISV